MLKETKTHKIFASPTYNYVFDKRNGNFARWGCTHENDPLWSEFGPEILDLEISTGECLGRCAFCYKENGTPKHETKHMTLETFEDLLSRMGGNLTQIAFGITDVYGNPDFFSIMRHARERGIIPNYTTHGLDLDDFAAELTAELCGAVAVSIVNREKSYDAIMRFTEAGMDQINIHCMLSGNRLEFAKKTVGDVSLDPRLAGIKAIVFLQYKPKGCNTDSFSTPTLEQFKELIEYCDDRGVAYGFDSCTAPLYLEAIQGHPRYEQLEQCVEPCESGLFSSYVNVDGDFYACSFCEGEQEWKTGINVFDYENFNQLWHSPRLGEWRKRLLDNDRACPMYELGGCCGQKLHNIQV